MTHSLQTLCSEEGARRLSEARELRKQKVSIMTTAHDSATTSGSEADNEEDKAEEKQLVVLVRADTQVQSGMLYVVKPLPVYNHCADMYGDGLTFTVIQHRFQVMGRTVQWRTGWVWGGVVRKEWLLEGKLAVLVFHAIFPHHQQPGFIKGAFLKPQSYMGLHVHGI